jgi:hypothetical protein
MLIFVVIIGITAIGLLAVGYILFQRRKSLIPK